MLALRASQVKAAAQTAGPSFGRQALFREARELHRPTDWERIARCEHTAPPQHNACTLYACAACRM